MLDLILKNCNIIDGVSDVSFYSDIGILENAIVKVGNLKDYKAAKTIDCEGLHAAPGFIDVHSHSDFNAFIDNGFDSKVRQGVTTEVIGNCGYSIYPLAGEFLEKIRNEANDYGVEVNWSNLCQYAEEIRRRGKLKVNLLPLTGLSAIRASVSGYSAKPSGISDMDKMKELVSKTMIEGSSGLSSGLIYPPCCYFQPDEIIELLKIAARYGGIYSTHMRSEGNQLLEAVNEAVSAAKKAKIPLQISHLKTAERHNWYKLDSVFELIEAAQLEGAEISADRYPYLASQTSLDMILPKWVFDSGDELSIRRLNDPLISSNIKSEILKSHPADSDYWESVMVSKTAGKEFLKFEGMNFRQVYNIIK
ncbi:MAG TPA: D-aminoacylase, partial [Candidatus Wallbacteria bacterium]|nr:D-aminoacylase [Candidatus Wallbacteria bacterium]